ncbi:hypothetical protein [Streptomyces sp. CA-111067]|uniref:hypothetical protein n=1 Tax=Streptomyces sp. CA-111067 TaxID=3240046 RepID=UPI003D95ABD8
MTFSRPGGRVTARTSGPFDRADRAPASAQEHGYAHLTTALRQRGVECTVEYGLSDYIVCAELPDHSTMIISPPQEPPADHPPGHPPTWLVTRSHPYDTAVHSVVYSSEPGGPHAQHQGEVPPLLAAIDTFLDQLGLEPRGPMAAFARFNAADAILHRAGFVSEVTHYGRFHRLPATMTDPAEQRRAVTRAFDALQAGGITVSCDPDLLDPNVPILHDHEQYLGDQLADLARSIARADHTTQVVSALSELTAPDDGVLDRITEFLNSTAGWWEGLVEPADPLHADHLRRIARTLTVSFLEIRKLRDTLADRHTAHPLRPRPDRLQPAAARAGTALASVSKAPPATAIRTASPTVSRARS